MQSTHTYDKCFIYSFKDAEKRAECVIQLLSRKEVRAVEMSYLKDNDLSDICITADKEYYRPATKTAPQKKLTTAEVFNLLTKAPAISFAFAIESQDERDVYMYYTDNDVNQKLIVETCSDMASVYLEKIISSL